MLQAEPTTLTRENLRLVFLSRSQALRFAPLELKLIVQWKGTPVPPSILRGCYVRAFVGGVYRLARVEATAEDPPGCLALQPEAEAEFLVPPARLSDINCLADGEPWEQHGRRELQALVEATPLPPTLREIAAAAARLNKAWLWADAPAQLAASLRRDPAAVARALNSPKAADALLPGLEAQHRRQQLEQQQQLAQLERQQLEQRQQQALARPAAKRQRTAGGQPPPPASKRQVSQKAQEREMQALKLMQKRHQLAVRQLQAHLHAAGGPAAVPLGGPLHELVLAAAARCGRSKLKGVDALHSMLCKMWSGWRARGSHERLWCVLRELSVQLLVHFSGPQSDVWRLLKPGREAEAERRNSAERPWWEVDVGPRAAAAQAAMQELTSAP